MSLKPVSLSIMFMKNTVTLILMSLMIFCLLACGSNLTRSSKAASDVGKSPSFSEFSSIEDGSLEIPAFPFETWNLDNGLKVYFSHDPELPLVSTSLFIPRGSFWESAKERGIYQALGDNMRAGGTLNLSPQELDRELEKLAATISSSFGQEFGAVTSAGLSTDFDKIFALMSEVLLRPRFDRDRLSLWKGQNNEAIKRRVDDPMTVAALSMRELLIGGSPYGAVTDSQDILKITRPKLRTHHSKVVIPDGALLAISGNITREQAERTVEKYLGDWQKSTSSLALPSPFPPQKNTGIYFIEQPLAQTTILIGQLGPERFSPDQYAIEVFNQYFGSGGFGSVLMKKIRTEMGLAYGIFGSILPGYGRGRALINLQTKPESCGPAIVESLKSLQQVQENEIEFEDLIETKKGISNTFIFNFTSPSQVLARKVQFDLLGYPKDFDQQYLKNIQAVTSEDVKNAARKRWDFNEFVVVVVGPKDALLSLESAQSELPTPLNSSEVRKGHFYEAFSVLK